MHVPKVHLEQLWVTRALDRQPSASPSRRLPIKRKGRRALSHRPCLATDGSRVRFRCLYSAFLDRFER